VKAIAALALAVLWVHPAEAQTVVGPRPEIKLARADEDWSPLADPALRTEPLDQLKYLPLGDDPDTYLSFGTNLRERFVHSDARLFGATGIERDDFLLNRAYLHADLHIAGGFQTFVQVEHTTATGLKIVGPADVNRLDLRQGFVGYRGKTGLWSYGIRVGRQEVAFDLERLVSLREGPNVRQAFDAVLATANNGKWDVRVLASHPVQYRPGTFDDTSNPGLGFYAVRLEHQLAPGRNVSAYVGHLVRRNARLGDAAGTDKRTVFDVRYFQPAGPVQIDVEAMLQVGRLGQERIAAWAIGARARYLIVPTGLRPKLGLQVDLASGDQRPGDGRDNSFYPLFPNGLYFTQAGYTGYANLIHIKPTVAIEPMKHVTALLGAGFQWRQTIADAVYVQPSIAVPKTAGRPGRPGRYTGRYGQAQLGWQVNTNTKLGAEFVYFAVGDALRQSGARDGKYLGIDFAFAW
jgi:Alginate export